MVTAHSDNGIVELRYQFPFNFFTGQLHRAFLIFDFLSINLHEVCRIDERVHISRFVAGMLLYDDRVFLTFIRRKIMLTCH